MRRKNNMKKGFYECDCGSAAVRIGENLILYNNGIGDGEYEVFEFESEKEFNDYRKKLGIYNPCFIGSAIFRGAQVVDYDCGPVDALNKLFELNGRYGIYNNNSDWELAGQVYFVKWED
jgi:hypothetical protein